MNRVHIYAPEPTGQSYRVLRKRGIIFSGGEFETWRDAFEFGIARCPDGFRVFLQYRYEWHDAVNVELIKVSDEMAKRHTEDKQNG